MDPTQELILIRDSFSREPLTTQEIVDLLPTPYMAENLFLIKKIQTASETQIPNLAPDPQICDLDRYQALQELKDVFDFGQTQNEQYQFLSIRNRANPFEDIGKSIFMNRAAIKLANIDPLYNLTHSFGGLREMRDDQRFVFVDIAAGPGGFTQYIQWRKIDAMGIGMTLRSGIDWDKNQLDPNRINFYYGQDETGNLYTNWQSLIKLIKGQYSEGADLLTGDGGFEVESVKIDGLDQQTAKAVKAMNYKRQEFLSSRLLLVQILTAINAIREGANCLIKTFDTVTALSAQLIFLMSLSFDELSIIKPISSRPANAEKYLIGKGRRKDITQVSSILDEANQSYREETNIIKLIDNPLPDDFLQWLKKQNSLSTDGQIDAAEKIVKLMAGEEIEHPPYDLRKALILWQVPDNPLPSGRRSWINL